MAKEKTLQDLFHETLKDIYYAKRKILKTLPKIKRAAHSVELKAAFAKHHQETQGQIERLQQVFEETGKQARGKTCDAIEGLISEGEEIIEDSRTRPLSTPASSLRPRRSSITRSRGTAR